MSQFDYPAPSAAQFSASVVALLPMLRGGTLLSEKTVAGYHARVISGYALDRALGAPSSAPVVAGFELTGYAGSLTDAQAVDVLDRFNTDEVSPEVVSTLPIPWLSLAAWAAQLLVRIIL